MYRPLLKGTRDHLSDGQYKDEINELERVWVWSEPMPPIDGHDPIASPRSEESGDEMSS
jgi:hypothetical protein